MATARVEKVVTEKIVIEMTVEEAKRFILIIGDIKIPNKDDLTFITKIYEVLCHAIK